MYLFNRTHIIYDRCRHEPKLILAKSRFEALLYVARHNKYSDQPYLKEFIEKRKPIIIDRMRSDDTRLELIEHDKLSDLELLDIAVELEAIKIDHLERFIVKNDIYVYSLVEIGFENPEPKLEHFNDRGSASIIKTPELESIPDELPTEDDSDASV